MMLKNAAENPNAPAAEATRNRRRRRNCTRADSLLINPGGQLVQSSFFCGAFMSLKMAWPAMNFKLIAHCLLCLIQSIVIMIHSPRILFRKIGICDTASGNLCPVIQVYCSGTCMVSYEIPSPAEKILKWPPAIERWLPSRFQAKRVSNERAISRRQLPSPRVGRRRETQKSRNQWG